MSLETASEPRIPSPAPGAECLRTRALAGISEIDAAAWDACAGAGAPFARHAFLRALEDSGSACPRTGWLARHVVIEDRAGRPLGAMPLYLKSHSMGEYVFDHGWADAFERAGGRYYPKLLAGIPFTPVTGPRLLVREGAEARAVGDALIAGARELAERHDASSVHVIFPTAGEWDRLGRAGFLQRRGVQFHWENAGYGSFDDFLATLSSRKRKQIRRERREALARGVTIETLEGADIEERHWDEFFAGYRATSDGKWGIPYLAREFFSALGETMADAIVLVTARAGGRMIAGALNLKGADRLYGRNWGCLEPRRFLHFEVCYYRAIDYAIARGLAVVEAGAQGAHKLFRGYRPRPTYSAHWIAHAGLRDAVAEFLAREGEQVDVEIAQLARYTPFRKENAAE